MMKSQNTNLSSIPRDMKRITETTGNVYKSLVVISKRALQLSITEKAQITEKLAEFAPRTDTLEEVFDNREQMEISAHFERQPKPTLVAIEEFLDNKVYFRTPEIDPSENQE